MERNQKLLTDIYSAINLITDFVSTTKNFEDYTSDLKTQSAVERQLAIIGEALNQLRKLDENSIEINSAIQIISFRNRLVHSYDSIDNSVVWAIIKKHLPILKEDIKNKLH
jgi:uncharacterized protein with HEPN domain